MTSNTQVDSTRTIEIKVHEIHADRKVGSFSFEAYDTTYLIDGNEVTRSLLDTSPISMSRNAHRLVVERGIKNPEYVVSLEGLPWPQAIEAMLGYEAYVRPSLEFREELESLLHSEINLARARRDFQNEPAVVITIYPP